MWKGASQVKEWDTASWYQVVPWSLQSVPFCPPKARLQSLPSLLLGFNRNYVPNSCQAVSLLPQLPLSSRSSRSLAFFSSQFTHTISRCPHLRRRGAFFTRGSFPVLSAPSVLLTLSAKGWGWGTDLEVLGSSPMNYFQDSLIFFFS